MALPDEAQQTPLEQLQAMNEQVGKTRRRKARAAKEPSKKVERFMRAQLQSLIKAIQKEVESEVVPVIEQDEDQYRQTTDSVPTMDGWAERIIAVINAIANRYTGPQSVFRGQYERLAQRTVSMAEAESTQAFVDSVNRSVGVDLNPVLGQEGISDYLEVATQSNIELISSVPDEYLDRVKNSVWGGVRNGDAPKKIREDIRNATGVTENQAKRIARDQSAKLTSEITERRQSQAGVKYYRVSTAGDNRVTGKPGGKYPNAKISCWGIANRDIGYGKGVYRWDEGASWGGQTGLHPGRHHIQCRCTATPVFEFELPKDKRK